MDFIISCIIYHLFYDILIIFFHLKKIENYDFLHPLFISIIFLIILIALKIYKDKAKNIKLYKIINKTANIIIHFINVFIIIDCLFFKYIG